MSNRVAIAILHYRMPELLASMERQLASGKYDVYVFDNGGLDLPPIKWATPIIWGDRLLFTKGWNRAMMFLTEYDYVWMLNNDVEGVSHDMASELLDSFSLIDYLSHDPRKVAAITPAFNSPHPIFHSRPEYTLRHVNWVDWCCPMVSMKAWESVGPFDPQFVGYGSDIDWCKRARNGSWSFYVIDRLQVHHLGAATAIYHGVQALQGNLTEMNELLRKKWGVTDWTQLT